jgi:hypothetical protein
MVGEVALEFFGFTLLIIIPPQLHTYLSPPHEVCNTTDQAAQYHTFGPKFGASSLNRQLASLGIKVVFMTGPEVLEIIYNAHYPSSTSICIVRLSRVNY